MMTLEIECAEESVMTPKFKFAEFCFINYIEIYSTSLLQEVTSRGVLPDRTSSILLLGILVKHLHFADRCG